MCCFAAHGLDMRASTLTSITRDLNLSFGPELKQEHLLKSIAYQIKAISVTLIYELPCTDETHHAQEDCGPRRDPNHVLSQVGCPFLGGTEMN